MDRFDEIVQCGVLLGQRISYIDATHTQDPRCAKMHAVSDLTAVGFMAI